MLRQICGANGSPVASCFDMVVAQMVLPIAHGWCHMTSAPSDGVAKAAFSRCGRKMPQRRQNPSIQAASATTNARIELKWFLLTFCYLQ
eukprot:s2857_g7.t1